MKRASSPTCRPVSGFTLIELLTVLAIIGVLMGLLFPAVTGVMDQAKKTQARNDIMQTIIATKGFYTEYSRYPNNGSANGEWVITSAADCKILYDVLRKKEPESATMQNPRGIVFYEAKVAKAAPPKNGIGADGALYDPWGNVYKLVIDGDYDNQIALDSLAGLDTTDKTPTAAIDTGVVGSSAGKDKTPDTKDDVTSW